MVQIKWTLLAKEDLKNITEYISNDSVKYAKLQVIRIKNRTKILQTHIRIGKVVSEIGNSNIRELEEGNYRIIYRIVSKNQVDILTIHHTARDLKRRSV